MRSMPPTWTVQMSTPVPPARASSRISTLSMWTSRSVISGVSPESRIMSARYLA